MRATFLGTSILRNTRNIGLLRPIAAAAVWTVLASACADPSAWLRRYTYPPDFQYISSDQLRSGMWQLASDVRALDHALRHPQEQPDPKQIAALLERMEQVTNDLKTDASRSNHPLLEWHLDEFREDVVRARHAVLASSPSYYLAGAVAGGCLYCHSDRG